MLIIKHPFLSHEEACIKTGLLRAVVRGLDEVNLETIIGNLYGDVFALPYRFVVSASAILAPGISI